MVVLNNPDWGLVSDLPIRKSGSKSLETMKARTWAGKGGSRTRGEGAQHAKRGAGDAVHVRQAEGDVDDDGQHNSRHDARLVAQSQTKDDVGGGTGAARLSHRLHQTSDSQ